MAPDRNRGVQALVSAEGDPWDGGGAVRVTGAGGMGD